MAIIFLVRKTCQSTNPSPVLKVQSSSSTTVEEAAPSSFLLRGGTNSVVLYVVVALASLHARPTNRVTFLGCGASGSSCHGLPFINAGNVWRPGMILLISFAACLMPTAYRSLAATCIGWGYCLPSSWLLSIWQAAIKTSSFRWISVRCALHHADVRLGLL